jgi:hypothetical protein
VVVTEPVPVPAEAETEYAATLQDACRRASALGVAEIELRWNGRLVSQPLEVTSPRLTLRAAAGFKPIIVFEPAGSQRHSIRLSGGASSRISVQGVELRLELPAEPADGWSLFSMTSGQSLDLSDCVLTMVDGAPESSFVHEQVAMIALQPRRSGDAMTMFDPQPAMAQSAMIVMENCVARGEATMIAMADETPLTLHWNQGLIATSRRLMETGGSATDPKFFEKIAIHLESVTANCRQGLFQMRRPAGKAYQFAVDVAAEHCILASDVGAPLYEFVAASPIAESDVRLQSNGDSNCYPNAEVVFLRIGSESSSEKQQDFELDDRRWSTETRPQVGSPWLHPLPKDIPPHALQKADFLVDPALAVGVGYDPLRLPEASSGR